MKLLNTWTIEGDKSLYQCDFCENMIKGLPDKFIFLHNKIACEKCYKIFMSEKGFEHMRKYIIKIRKLQQI